MYGITLSSPECPLFFESNGDRITTFTVSQVKAIIDELLSRKARNNGVGKHLLHTLRVIDSARYDFPKRMGDSSLGFSCRAMKDSVYAIRLHGEYPSELLCRLNRRHERSSAIVLTQSLRAKRRHLRTFGLYKDRPKQKSLRQLAGASANLRQHFRNSEISCGKAIAAIAYATRFDHQWVGRHLFASLDERFVASLRLKGGFVFRLDLVTPWRGMVSKATIVTLKTTNDNTHGAYRRMRSFLRKRLNCERKAQAALLRYFAREANTNKAALKRIRQED